MLDYDNVLERVAAALSPPIAFDRAPARDQARRPASARASTRVSRPDEKPASVRSDDHVSVVWNADKSITMAVAMPDAVADKENRTPAQQRRHRNETYLVINSPARVSSPSPSRSTPPSRSLTHQVWTPRPATPPEPQRTERSAADVWLSRPEPPAAPAVDLSRFGPLPPKVVKIITPPNDAESFDQLSPTHLSQRKSQSVYAISHWRIQREVRGFNHPLPYRQISSFFARNV